MDGKWGFIDKNGNDKVAFRYDKVADFEDGLALVELNGKLGFVNRYGREVIDVVYDNLIPGPMPLNIILLEKKNRRGESVLHCYDWDGNLLEL